MASLRRAFARRYGIAVHRLYYRITTAGARVPVSERGPVPFHPVRVMVIPPLKVGGLPSTRTEPSFVHKAF